MIVYQYWAIFIIFPDDCISPNLFALAILCLFQQRVIYVWFVSENIDSNICRHFY